MDGQVKELLAESRGENEWVVVSLVDIRGFTTHQMEAVEAALFLKTVYRRIIEEYLQGEEFLKLTGDGILIVEAYEPGGLNKALAKAVRRWLKLLKAFPSFCDKNPEIRFDVPRRLGIGIDFGAASRLVSGPDTLDFFGKPLNMAARLCDFARPSGMVVSDVSALQPVLRERFVKESVYIKGISELKPITVFALKGVTKIPAYGKFPLVEPEYKERSQEIPMNVMKKLAAGNTNYVIKLPDRPLGDEVSVRVEYRSPAFTGTLSKRLTEKTYYSYSIEAGKPQVRLTTRLLHKQLEEAGVGPRSKVDVAVVYAKRPQTVPET